MKTRNDVRQCVYGAAILAWSIFCIIVALNLGVKDNGFCVSMRTVEGTVVDNANDVISVDCVTDTGETKQYVFIVDNDVTLQVGETVYFGLDTTGTVTTNRLSDISENVDEIIKNTRAYNLALICVIVSFICIGNFILLFGVFRSDNAGAEATVSMAVDDNTVTDTAPSVETDDESYDSLFNDDDFEK